jgi:hypothetical protein
VWLTGARNAGIKRRVSSRERQSPAGIRNWRLLCGRSYQLVNNEPQMTRVAIAGCPAPDLIDHLASCWPMAARAATNRHHSAPDAA